MDGLHALGGRVGFFGHEQFQGVQRGGHVAAEDLQELQVALAEGPRLHAFHVEGADHFVVQQQRHGQRALRPADAFHEQRVFGRVFAKVALARRRHETGHAVALGQRDEVANRRVGVHAHGQERFQAVRLAIQETDLGHFEVQQVFGVVDDVGLEQLDPVADRHVEDLFRSQVGQLHAGLVDRGQLLLLLHLVRHVADGNDQVPGRTVQLADRGRLHLEVAIVLAPQRGTRPLAGGQRRVEGTEVRPQDFRAAEGRVKVDPRHRIAAAPFAHPPIAPDDGVVVLQQGDPVGHALQDLLVLQEFSELEGLAEVLGGDENAVELPAGQQGQGPHGVLHDHHFVRLRGDGERLLDVLAGVTDQQDLGLFRQCFHAPVESANVPRRTRLYGIRPKQTTGPKRPLRTGAKSRFCGAASRLPWHEQSGRTATILATGDSRTWHFS